MRYRKAAIFFIDIYLKVCLLVQLYKKTSNSKQMFHVQDRISYTIISRIKFYYTLYRRLKYKSVKKHYDVLFG